MSFPHARRRLIAAAAGALLMVSAVVAGFVLKERSGTLPARPPGERPALLLLTSLPIVFPEQFTLDRTGSPALTALQSRYEVVPVSTADAATLEGRGLLLMAQPHAQPAETLVELDAWVRGGGKVLLLADPALEWPSELPLGDLARPPSAFPDTGLLGHWGLRLDAPNERGAQAVHADGQDMSTASPGRLAATGRACRVQPGGFLARCVIGKGRVTVVADADFLESGGPVNLEFLLRELNRLEQ